MKHIFISFLFMVSFPAIIQASEITGKISTNPDDWAVNPESYREDSQAGSQNKPENKRPGALASPAPILRIKSPITANNVKNAENMDNPSKTSVLGVKIISTGSLARAKDNKIFLIRGNFKKHIQDLKELRKYTGQKISAVSEQELSQYRTLEHSDGELVREINDIKVYVIRQEKARHILNLEELRKHYHGLEIFNISKREMGDYL